MAARHENGSLPVFGNKTWAAKFSAKSAYF